LTEARSISGGSHRFFPLLVVLFAGSGCAALIYEIVWFQMLQLVIGSSAVDLIRQFKVDMAVIGASALDEDGSLLDYDPREVNVSRAIIDNARSVLLVCDRTKLDRAAPVRIGHMSEIHAFVTDQLNSAKLREVCNTHGVKVVEAAKVDDIVGMRAHGAGADGVVDARAGVQGVAHHVAGATDSRPGEVLAGHVAGQRALGENLAGDAEHRCGGRAVGVVFEGIVGGTDGELALNGDGRKWRR